MTSDEMDRHREAFEAAAARLGWRKREITVDHERDMECSWKEVVWFTASGKRLFSETELEEGLAQQIIQLEKSLGVIVHDRI